MLKPIISEWSCAEKRSIYLVSLFSYKKEIEIRYIEITVTKFESIKCSLMELIEPYLFFLSYRLSFSSNFMILVPSLIINIFQEWNSMDFTILSFSKSLSLEANIMFYDLSEFFHTHSEKNNLYFYDNDNLTLERDKLFSASLKEVMSQCTT